MPNYSHERKASVLSKLLPPNNHSVTQTARAEGIHSSTLYNWIAKAQSEGLTMPGKRTSNAEQWSGEAKLSVVVETMPMNNAEKAAYCRKKGLFPEQIERWHKACILGMGTKSKENEPARKAQSEIKRLKRKIARKDKALAESAALLVLSKKFQALWEEEDQ